MDGFPYVALLKACAKNRDLCKGSRLHAAILRDGLVPERTPHLATGLISMYAKCGMFEKAQDLIQNLSSPHVVPWNALISGYVQNGKPHQAIDHFEHMQREGLFPNAVTFICILKACGSIGAIGKGKQIHEKLMNLGLLEKDVVLGTALVDMYAKCGNLAKAQEVLEQLPVRDAVTWNALITGYTQQGRYCRALDCFELMQNEGLSPDEVTFLSVLKACGSTRAIDKGKQINDEILRTGFLGKDIAIGTALVDMYAKCGALAKAQQVFDVLPIQNTVSWNVLISGYCQHGHCEEALKCFQEMRCQGVSPNSITFACVLKICGKLGAVEKGKNIHQEILREGYLENNSTLGNALVEMYAKCGDLGKAQDIFDDLIVLDVIGFTSLITGYGQHGYGDKALKCLEHMRSKGLSPDAMAFTCILKACGSMGAAETGKEIHADIVKEGLLVHDSVLGNALVDMYAKCGALAMAQQVFDEISIRDIVSWTSLISGYGRHGLGEETLNCFQRMQLEGLYPNAVTFVCLLQTCGSLGAMEKGKEIHTELVKEGLLEKDGMLGNALVDMYCKCGAIVKAEEVFHKLPNRGVVAWTALIAGYSHVGRYDAVFNSFNKMIGEGVEPNMITFLVVLSACSSSGLVDEGQMYFETMTSGYCIAPTIQHYTCMIDLFGRGGHFDKAVSMVGRMPSIDYLPAWLALLGACQKWGNLMLGRLAFEHSIRLDEKCAVAYDLMSTIYLAAGMQEDSAIVESMRMENKAW